MKYTSMDLEYLSGKRFSNGYKLKLNNNLLYNRLDTLVNICRGKKIIHVGCCDHLPLIDKKIQENSWLQKILDDNCEYVFGVDLNNEAVEFVNNNHLSKVPVVCADITSDDFLSLLPSKDFDSILMGEIVEHIDNPVSWLKSIKDNFEKIDYQGNFIITVPNAFSFLNSKYAQRGVENINSDHKYWFTPYTISKVLVEAGIIPEEIIFASYGAGGNGSNPISRRMFVLLEKLRGKPSSFESYRGDQMVIIGR